MGFPALRTVSWERPRIESSLGAGRAVAADLLPIITEGADPRLDGLKQRIVTLDHQRKTEAIEGGGERYDRLMQDLFNIFDDVLEGMRLKIKRVDPETREITVVTEDGEVPFESLSQGTTSLIGLAGVLLQRLHDTAAKDEKDPRKRFGLVLIDELDAHMHPSWQQGIVARLRKTFPNAQFIAATHSPLVVRGMDVKCVTRFIREDGSVKKMDLAEDMTMGRTDQVLAGSLFDTDGLDGLTEEVIAEYQDLLGEDERPPDREKKIFQELRNELEHRIPVPDTTPRGMHMGWF